LPPTRESFNRSAEIVKETGRLHPQSAFYVDQANEKMTFHLSIARLASSMSKTLQTFLGYCHAFAKRRSLFDYARDFISDHDMDWPQALLGEKDNPLVRQQLGISSVPIYYVLDPQGKLIHRSFRLKEAVELLEERLAEEE
jgi:hypothetical protein